MPLSSKRFLCFDWLVADYTKEARRLAAKLGLGHWTIKVKEGKHKDWAHAYVEEYDHVTIVVSPHFTKATVAERKEILLHELMHCHTRRIIDPYVDLCRALLVVVDKKNKPAFRAAFAFAQEYARQNEERAVEHLAQALKELI